MPKAFEEFQFSDSQKSGPVSEFWENVHLAAKALKESGAKEIYSYIAHGVLSGNALNKINDSEIKELVLTDSIEASEQIKKAKNVRHISIAPLMGEAIKRINSDSSVSALFE